MATTFGWSQQRTAAPQDQSQIAAAAAENNLTKDASRTSKQKLLGEQAQRLVTMANELKVAVDKTNKDILSLDVVKKAEQIELLARQMKDQGKKQGS